MKIVVIGAAPTALGAAYRLNELIEQSTPQTKGVELVVLEKNSEPGGLSSTITDEVGFSWDLGAHITYSEGVPYYDKAMREAIDDWNTIERNTMVDMNTVFGVSGIRLVPYPAQFAVPLFPIEVKKQCLWELKERYDNIKKFSPKTFEDWVNMHLGPTIHDVFFRSYNRKVWTVETSEMNSNWVGLRVAKLPQEKLEEMCAMDPSELEKADLGWGGNARFKYPKRGGTGAVWKAVEKRLPAKWFNYNTNVVSIDATSKFVEYTDQNGERREQDYDVLLSTIPADQLIEHTKLTAPLKVLYNKVFVVGVGLRKPTAEIPAKHTWLYFPDEAVPFFRVTMISRFGEMTPDDSKYWSLLVECSLKVENEASEEVLSEQVLDGLVYKNLIRREDVVHVWKKTIPYGYPIPSLHRDSEMARAHAALERASIYSRGRFGGWKYEVSNQDHCFIQGKEFIDRILFNEPEKMYSTGVEK